MKALANLKLLPLLLFFTTTVFAQETVNKDDMIIHATILDVMTIRGGVNIIDVYKRGTHAEIIYGKFNRIDYVQIEKDTAYINNHLDFRVFDAQKFKLLKPIYDRHTIYDTTQVTIDLKTDTAYNKILISLAKDTKEELETSIVGERHYLDGFIFVCTITTNTGSKHIEITNPSDITHPIISALLKQSYNRLWPDKNKTK